MTLAIVDNPITTSDIISPYMVVFFVAFGVTIFTTPMMRWLATRNGIVDWPDRKRKSHIEPVAYLGGVAIFLGWLAGVSLCYGGYSFVAPPPDEVAVVVPTHIQFPFSIILGAAVIMFTGLIDDVYGISPRVKVGGQFLAAGMLAMNHVGTNLVGQLFKVIDLPAPDWLIYILGAVVIAVFVLGGCNAVNLMDGLDGLASGVVIIAAAGFLFIATYVAISLIDQGKPLTSHEPIRIIVMCLAILGAILGFLPYNFNPANIFMGDAGSLLLGYLSVTTILMFAEAGGQGPRLVTAALIVFALPITDTALAIFRRVMSGQPILSPDNEHIHHQILAAAQKNLNLGPNLAVKFSVLVMYALTAVFATLGYALVSERWRFVVAVFVVVFGFVIVSAYKVGHRQVLLEQLKTLDGNTTENDPVSSDAASAEIEQPSASSDPHQKTTPLHQHTT